MKNLICLLLVAFLATTTFAQKKGMNRKADATVERMTKELDLSPEQQVKIKAIYETKIADKTSRSAQTREGRSMAKADFDQKIEAVLTPEQIKKRKALKKEHKAKMKAHRQERVANGHSKQHKGKKGKSQRFAKMSPEMIENRAVKSTEKLNTQVNLTEAQQATAKAAYLGFYQKNQAIANDTSLDAAEKKERLSDLRADHKAEIKSLLTEEQLAAKKVNKKLRKANRKQKQQR